MSEGIFCKNCLEQVQINNVRYYDIGLCSGDAYCEYCGLTYVTNVCCGDFLEYLELDDDYESEVYWEE